ncbi:hypothetical protein V8C86DRAFT_1093931 [Haematococcus lacustris]
MSTTNEHKCKPKRPRADTTADAAAAAAAAAELPFQRIAKCWNAHSLNLAVKDCSKLQAEWWKALRAVIRLLQPICDYIHKLEADTPYLSQMLPIWDNLMSGAEAWVQSLPGGAANPLAHGVLKLFAERRAKSYSPVMAAAYLLDPVNFTLATPSRSPWQLPPFERLIGDQEQDAISTVVRLSKHFLPGQTAAQVQAAVALEVTRLQELLAQSRQQLPLACCSSLQAPGSARHLRSL